MNYSKQRETIYNILLDNYSHPTANEVYELTRKVLPHISRGTVYRNLATLVQQNKVRRLDIDNMQSRFDAHMHEHAHFKCIKCGKLYDADVDVTTLSNKYEQSTGNQVYVRNLLLEGVCKDCKSNQNN